VEIGGKRLEVTIPRGAGTGNRIRLTGKAPGGGDLVVATRLQPHATFTRRGDDLERELPVTLREALLGGEVPVGTLKGRVLLKLPPGTQSGRTFRLKGQGMPRFKGDGTGDLYVKVRVVLPGDLTDQQAKAAAAFLDTLDQPDPRAGSTN
jgi:DnaJ-class molecular chaperone